jgi:hypothetical protein
MAEAFHETLWKLADSWPCDYAAIERPADKKKPKAIAITKHRKVGTPTTISLHLDSCRKCALRLHLIRIDELLKRIAEVSYQDFCRQPEIERKSDAFSEGEYEAVQDHAQTVRDMLIGAPKG